MKTYDVIYKRDSSNRIRVWWMVQDGDQYASMSGILGGAVTESGWTVAVPASQPTAEAQATFEIEAAYEHKLTREYHANIDTIDQANFFKPMLAHKFETWTGNVASQPKLDGIRCITNREGMFSREGKPILGAPHIRDALRLFFLENPDAVLDGELYNHDLKDDFNAIVSAVKKKNPTPAQLFESSKTVQYWVYDIPSKGSLPFVQRSFHLSTALAVTPACIVTVKTDYANTFGALDALYGAYLEQGYEGQMVRATDSRYEQKRSKALLKRKEFQDAEFECVSIEPGVGNWAGLAKSVTCRLPDGRTFGAGIKGNEARAKELLSETHKVVTVKFFNYTPAGVPRFGVVTAFHGEGRTL